jgi:uncharacterized membrane protein YphA (DoxX/SURF4 family)
MMSSKCSASCKHWGLFLIRLALAIVFIVHGVQKLQNMSMTVAFFAQLGIPAFFTWLAALGELAGGIAMLVGKWTKYAGYLLAFIMVVATYCATWKMGFSGGWEFTLVLFLISMGVAWTGPGSIVACGGACPCGADACKGGCQKTEGCCKK